MKRSDLDKVWARLRGGCQAKGAGEQGIALISVILLVLVLSFVSAAAIVTSTTELRIGGNFKTSTQSFYNAEAGVQYALGQIRKQYATDDLNFVGSEAVIHYLPTNEKLPFSNWTTTHLKLKTGTTSDYQFQTTGYSANSQTKLEAVVRIPSYRLVRGMFASGALTVRNVLRWSESLAAPEFGSNTSLSAGNREFPKVVLGGDAIYGDRTNRRQHPDVKEVRTMEVDPLGAESLVKTAKDKYSISNMNHRNTEIIDKAISSTTTLQPGDYYLTSLRPGSRTTLTIDGPGAVNIYVADNLSLGNITINEGSGPLTIYYDGAGPVVFDNADLNSTGDAGNLRIIAGYKPDDPDDPPVRFAFDNGADITGLIYAPFADIVFRNQADVKGLLWGGTISSNNSLTFNYDATVEEFFPAASLPMLMTWKQL